MYIRPVKLEDHLNQQQFASDSQRLHLHILVVARQLVSLARKTLHPHGISPPQYNVLRILRGQKGMPIAVQSIGSRMLDPSSNTSRIIDKLVDKGWAERKTCPSDRRRADILITESGLALLAKLDRPMAILLESMSFLTEEQLEELNAGLAQVLDQTDDILERHN